MIVVAYSGLTINLAPQDKDTLLTKGQITTKSHGWHICDVTLHLQEHIKNEGIEEAGFHITATPPNVPLAQRIRYDVYIDHRHLKNLIDRGYTGSRCYFDRVDITYYSIKKE